MIGIVTVSTRNLLCWELAIRSWLQQTSTVEPDIDSRITEARDIPILSSQSTAMAYNKPYDGVLHIGHVDGLHCTKEDHSAPFLNN